MTVFIYLYNEDENVKQSDQEGTFPSFPDGLVFLRYAQLLVT